MALLCGLLEPVEGFHAVRDQNGTVLVELADEALSMEITVFSFPDNPRCSSIPFCHGDGIIISNNPQFPDVVGLRRNICRVLVSHCFSGFILEGHFAQANILSFLNNCVFDGTKFFLLREWWPFPLLLRIKTFDLALELPPRLVAGIDYLEAQPAVRSGFLTAKTR